MIVKRVPLKKNLKSNYGRLAAYITSTQGKHERLGEVRVTNCLSDNPLWAVDEIETTQEMNDRTKLDKTYHLLISFRESDQPAPEVLHAIEDRLCAEIGYGEHQRISAVHHDTDHTHLHVAINKIHPKNYRATEPFYDKRKLNALAEKLEIEYGLYQDNHIPKMTAAASRAQDMEKAAGLESLIGWVKRGCLESLLAAKSWQELGRVLKENGLALKPQNNGFVITNSQGIGAKASSVHPQLSKNALIKRLGPLDASTLQVGGKAQDGYRIQPVASKVSTEQLWQAYQQDRNQHGEQYQARLAALLARKRELIAEAKALAKNKRRGIKLIAGQLAKQMRSNALRKKLSQDIEQINQEYKSHRSALIDEKKLARLIWHDWLKAKAQQGDAEALSVLRHRYERQARSGNLIGNAEESGLDNSRPSLTRAKIDTVTKRGTIHYQLPTGVVRDEGDRFRIADNLPAPAIKAALEMAIQRFGRSLKVEGSVDFEEQMIQTAAAHRLVLQFADPAMEAKRQALMKQLADGRQGRGEPSQSMGSRAAAGAYITERNQKQQRGLQVLPHRLYTDQDTGTYAYAGVRYVKQQPLLLLQGAQQILVIPIDQKTAIRMERTSIGAPVEIDAQGVIRTQSQSRGRSR